MGEEMNDSSDSWVKLNLGGVIFQTTKSTLMSDPNSLLAKMFSGKWNCAKDSSGAYLLDADAR
jgi:hypothetical protein